MKLKLTMSQKEALKMGLHKPGALPEGVEALVDDKYKKAVAFLISKNLLSPQTSHYVTLKGAEEYEKQFLPKAKKEQVIVDYSKTVLITTEPLT